MALSARPRSNGGVCAVVIWFGIRNEWFCSLQGVSWKVRFTRGGQKFVIPVSGLGPVNMGICKRAMVVSAMWSLHVSVSDGCGQWRCLCSIVVVPWTPACQSCVRNAGGEWSIQGSRAKALTLRWWWWWWCGDADYAVHNIEPVYSHGSFNHTVVRLCTSKGTSYLSSAVPAGGRDCMLFFKARAGTAL
jgi:hypothetical protein